MYKLCEVIMLAGCLQRNTRVLKKMPLLLNLGKVEMSLWLPNSATKRLKCNPESTHLDETCDVIIDINQDGSCKSQIIPMELKPSSVNCNIKALHCSSNGFNGNSTEGPGSKSKRQSQDAVKDETGFPLLTNYVALDCEFVGVRNDQSALGRCSIVDCEGRVLCDLYAMPEDPITHYRTCWSGITRNHMTNAIPLKFALTKISNILEGKIVVGHALTGDFTVLGFQPRPEFIRDTIKFKGLMGPIAGRKSLKTLALEHLGLQIQVGTHCSIQDACAAMSLYKLVRHEWETSLLAENSSKKENQSDPPENEDCIANDDYWDIKNPRDCKVNCSNVQQVFENTESKLSVLNKVLNKIKSDSGVVVKTESRKTKKSKKNFCGL